MNDSLHTAGLGARAWTFIIDWHIRAGIAGLLILLIAVRGSGFNADLLLQNTQLTDYILPLAIYFLYHPIVEILMKGRSPGKNWAGIHIVNHAGNTAGTGQLLIRNLLRLIDGLPLFYSLGVIYCFFNQHQNRIGDSIAKTRLVYITH